ncbi:carbon-nitrogen hydrolase family protein [Labrys sp. KB_33_2]|uniref:carbon-nitrogen hydrolase family protein n=1 Tax=Labrys TaxID=204476 RepID=UPI002ACA010C|nr:carbon-nitrogen hydrolase family protein [Labrys sp. ZIDIC5]MDZ5452690.1 carbon-nitrogen hydrolase family protein [Labrys sp. ZIDIC5]
MRFKAAVLQMRSGLVPSDNVATVAAAAREAKAAGAEYLQTPEMTTVVNRDRAAMMAAIGDEQSNPELDAFRAIARDNGLHLHIGSMAVRVGDKAANRAFVIDPKGEVLASYDKIHLFDVDLAGGESWRESNAYVGGDHAVTVDLPFARLGLGICYDVRFPQLFRAYGDASADVISAPACFTKQTGEAHWHVLQRARAIENGAWMISAAQVGHHDDGRDTYGHSVIIDPWGRVVADAGDTLGLVYGEIDVHAVAATRGKIPNLKNARSFTVKTEPALRAAE